MTKTIFISAGDPSADKHASKLLQQMPDANFIGMGGKHMQAAGLHCIVDASDLAVIGITEVLAKWFKFRRALNLLKSALKYQKPDLLICVDFAGFNLRLARVAKSMGIPVLYYISPQVWATRSYRVRTIKRVVDEVAVIFPFEKTFYQKHGMQVHYVGHPIMPEVDRLPIPTQRTDSEQPVIGLLPGSRVNEVQRLLPVMLATASQLRQRFPGAKFVIAKADNLTEAVLAPYQSELESLSIRLAHQPLYQTIQHCDALIAASGTVTLEIALLQKPFVLIYKVNRFTAWLVKRLLKHPYIGICNIIAGKRIIPECLQEDCQPENITHAITEILTDESKRQTMLTELKSIKTTLSTNQADIPLPQLVQQMLAGVKS